MLLNVADVVPCNDNQFVIKNNPLETNDAKL
jgi:hypothetical protein